MLSGQIEKAQRRVEEYHFEQRKDLLEYDEVMDYQRKRTYGARQDILDGANPRAVLVDMIGDRIDAAVKRYLADAYGPASFAEYAGNRLNVELDTNDFKNAGFDEAQGIARDRAIEAAPTFIQEAIDENLDGDDPKDWKWTALSNMAKARFDLTVSEKELKQVGKEGMSEYLLAEAEKAYLAADLSDGRRFLERGYGANSLADWARKTFALKIDQAEVTTDDPAALRALLRRKVQEAYRAKDTEFPVQVALAAYLPERRAAGTRQPNRENLFQWAVHRLAGADVSEEMIRTEARSAIKEKLLEAHRKLLPGADYLEIDAKLDEVFSGADTSEAADAADLVEFVKSELKLELNPADLTGVTRKTARDAILNAFDLKYRPEMHDAERRLVLDQIDSAWKAHLLTMDHLRSTVRLAGYAQEDPKIVYKREGMKLFDAMWEGVQERATELAFRVEDVGDDQVQSALWAGAMAVQHQAESAMRARASQVSAEQAAQVASGAAAGEAKKPETIRNTGAKVGRNDPCPCGSGKKYKNCHMKAEAGR
jgi:preprotein translocase subunit SecA